MFELIPQPRWAHFAGGSLTLSSLGIHELPERIGLYRDVIEELIAAVRGPAGAPARELHFAYHAGRAQEYRLEIAKQGITVQAADASAALYAVHTLLDIWEQTRPVLPLGAIVDYPTFAQRGVFVESFWGADHMGRQDWFDFIDLLAGLKFNTLAISLYGCWDLRHDADNGEFLFVPLERYPQLRTPHFMRTWDAGREQEIQYTYLPRMFEEDLFGDVARYAQRRGLRVIPMFGGPGHSSLIPRLVPQVSALDESGDPTGYGYCVTQPAARAALLDILDNLIEQHLVPAGIDTLWLPGDEFYPILNLDPQDPLRSFSPYCRC
jgi:N-acetyl-beta-hexosaminidase